MYLFEVPFKIQGIPCLLGVKSLEGQEPFKGSPQLCDSDLDYYGWTEIEFDVLDRKGYKAEWLAKKDFSVHAAERAILNHKE